MRRQVIGTRRLITTVRFKKPLLARLQKIADRRNITRSALIEGVLIDYANENRVGKDPRLDANGDIALNVDPEEGDLFA